MIETIKSLSTTLFYQPLFNLLFFFISILPGENLAAGIIGLTVVVRLMLVPSSARALRAQRELTALQPEINNLRADYKDKPEELNRQMLALYQKHNVNPFGSCLPILIQLPILLILYRVVLNGIHPDNFNLLYSFVPTPTALETMFLGISLEAPSLILGLIAGGLQFLQTWQMLRGRVKTKSTDPTTEATEQIGQRMTYLMPLLTVFISSTLPAALALYWVVTTLFSVIQQSWLLRVHPEIAKPHVAVRIKKK
ncbi:membrane protein insertase YidC [Candidatus Berkelbacteria bacterium]|nr:membrane protein insertase YidC [Candidatus Berkelbacteria bacterium]